MKLIEDYFDLQQQIFDYFGYKQDWCVFPLEDHTNKYWFVYRDKSCVWGPEPFTEQSIESGKTLYSADIINPFLPTGIYRKPEHTMICVDTHRDYNKVLMILDNTKECKDVKLIELHHEIW